MSQNVSFNLVDEPWICVRDLDGTTREVSLLELFEQASSIKCLANDLPTQDFAILRVLLAVLQRAISPALDDDDVPAEVWGRLWRAHELPIDQIHEYLDEWRHRFDLFDEEQPFMQVAGLHTAKNEFSEIRKVIADIPDGDTLFSLRSGEGADRLTFSESARWLIHVHAFDTAGIKSGTVGDTRVKKGKSYPIGTGWSGCLGGLCFEGPSLKETLLLNTILCGDEINELFSDNDLPCWEKTTTPAGVDDLTPTGRLDLYTWQARRVRLIPESGYVVAVVLTNGDKLAQINRQGYEPMTAWRRSPNQERQLKLPLVYLPKMHQPRRALWRGLDSVFGVSSPEADSTVLGSGLKGWVSYLASRDAGCQLDNALIQVHAIGMEYGTQSSVVSNVINDTVELSAFLLSSEGKDLAALAKSLASSTSDAVFALGTLAANLCVASGGNGADELKGAKEKAETRTFFEIDMPFRQWLAGLNESSNAVAERMRWHCTARAIIEANARALLREAGPEAIVGAPMKAGKINGWMTASRAKAMLNTALKKYLPLEEDELRDKEV